MTTNFLDTFGASAVSPSEVAFASYTFGTNLQLYWPQFSAGQTNVAARFMNMTASAGSLNVSMPDATLVSVGYDVIIFNAGSNTFNVIDYDGGAIATIATGQTYYVILNDNTTQAGGWQTVQFGVGTGSASAAALAGFGLLAIAGLLNVNFTTTDVSADYTINSGNRATLQVWTGGAGTVTLPSAASVGDGFFFPFANNGSGSVTITPTGGDTIDGESTSVFAQTQSGFIISSGTSWSTVGKGLQSNLAVTLLNLNVAGSSDVTETSAQAENIIQQFTGALTGNINVIVPNTVQLYYIYNNTTGSYTLTLKTAAGTGIVVPAASHVILYCDGTNVVNAFSSNTVTVGSVFYALGTAGGTDNALTGTASNFTLQLGTFVTFNPATPNTGPATLNVQGTGVIDLKKVSAAGLVDLDAFDLFPTVPAIAYYDGTYWVVVNLAYSGVYEAENSNFALTFANLYNSIICTSALSITLDPTADLQNYFYATIFASGGAVTLVPDAGDAIQGLSAGVSYVLPQGSSAKLATNGAGVWTLFYLTTPTIVNDTTTNATMYPVWVTANSGSLPLKVSSTKLSFNPSSGILTAVGYVGDITGNAATATALLNARTIGGVSFNGTANITVATATGGFTVSGGDLAVGANNISITGSLGSTGSRLTKGWFTDLQVTNAIAGSITGNAATVTTNANLTGDVTSSGNATTIKTDVALAGNPTTTTQAASNSSTRIATTAFVIGQSATQANQETATSTTLFVSPGRQQFHPSSPKAWVAFAGATGTISASYNVSGVVRSSTGIYVVSFTTAFSSVSYCAIVTPTRANAAGGNNGFMGAVGTLLAGSAQIFSNTTDSSGGWVANDATAVYAVFFGDQ